MLTVSSENRCDDSCNLEAYNEIRNIYVNTASERANSGQAFGMQNADDKLWTYNIARKLSCQGEPTENWRIHPTLPLSVGVKEPS